MPSAISQSNKPPYARNLLQNRHFLANQGLGMGHLRPYLSGAPAIAFQAVIVIVRPALAQNAADDRLNDNPISTINQGDRVMWISQAWAQAAGAAPGQDLMGSLGTFAPIILIFGIMYFLMIRPQQRRAKEHRALVQQVKAGDKIVLSSGLLGTVTQVTDENEVKVEIADGVRVRVLRNAISEVITNKVDTGKKAGDKAPANKN
ncbi:MAG TPA: preprotein translocase subunit YajC [Dongiaceae bacterium]|nr:preprotein translocase subunit YajC [Dongiaceae bacterium]